MAGRRKRHSSPRRLAVRVERGREWREQERQPRGLRQVMPPERSVPVPRRRGRRGS